LQDFSIEFSGHMSTLRRLLEPVYGYEYVMNTRPLSKVHIRKTVKIS
jgi:hypothetical protein